MKEPNSKHPYLTPVFKTFVDKLEKAGGKPLYELTPAEARQVLVNLQSGPVAKPDVDMEDTTMDVGNGSIPVRIVRPKGSAGKKLPGLLYVHGGGWIMGDKGTHDLLVRELAIRANVAVVYPVYTPSPEAQYPQPLEEIYAVLKRIGKDGASMNIDTDALAIAGDSAGGNMATVIAMYAKERGGPDLKFQLLLYPVTNGADLDTDSYDAFSDGPWLTKKAMVWFWDAYAPDKKTRKEKYVSPLLAEKGELAGLPPALVITDENDVLRDEGEAYARRLNEDGVRTANVRCNGAHHDFMMINDVMDSAPTQAALELSAACLRRVLWKSK